MEVVFTEMELSQEGCVQKFSWWVHLCDVLVGLPLASFPPWGNQSFYLTILNQNHHNKIAKVCMHCVIVDNNFLKQQFVFGEKIILNTSQNCFEDTSYGEYIKGVTGLTRSSSTKTTFSSLINELIKILF